MILGIGNRKEEESKYVLDYVKKLYRGGFGRRKIKGIRLRLQRLLRENERLLLQYGLSPEASEIGFISGALNRDGEGSLPTKLEMGEESVEELGEIELDKEEILRQKRQYDKFWNIGKRIAS